MLAAGANAWVKLGQTTRIGMGVCVCACVVHSAVELYEPKTFYVPSPCQSGKMPEVKTSHQ